MNWEMTELLVLCVFAVVFKDISASTEVCTNALLPGAKGDQGETGEEGDQGKLGKNGPPGLPGVSGEMGLKGDVGHQGKMGPIGDKGNKGDTGLEGPSGLKGKPVILGLKETEECYYLLVKEPKRFREALINCKLRGGTLAMPKTSNTNRLMADYVSQAGLARVFIGLQAKSKDTVGTSDYVYADSSPLQGFAAWSQEEELNSRVSPNTNSSCVELLSTGTWSHVECEANLFFMCEFPKSRRRGGAGGGGK
ncbi:collectin-10 isoform X3 [Etheostoma cragini]|uniref:collectin-10 isoform X3 n=1 Tax=Etheostoma cragini TaxID=417921 RepID=UPI00155E01D7|nr:collectin-10 isoform X3 [Etheostoma cragini]